MKLIIIDYPYQLIPTKTLSKEEKLEKVYEELKRLAQSIFGV